MGEDPGLGRRRRGQADDPGRRGASRRQDLRLLAPAAMKVHSGAVEGDGMKFSRLLPLALALSPLAALPALAAHGKVGLWNVTSSTEVALPPQLAAQMKRSGMTMPGAQPMTVQMCMSKEEVASNAPPHLDSGATGCNTRLVSQTAQAMRANIVCKGPMKGTGSI